MAWLFKAEQGWELREKRKTAEPVETLVSTFQNHAPPFETLLCVHFNPGLKHVGTRMYSYQGLSPGFSKNKQDAFVPQVSVEALFSIQIGKDHAKL